MTFTCIFAETKTVKHMKKLPQEEHKKRVLMFISPIILADLGKEACKEIGKKAIHKEHKKYLKSNKQTK